METIIQQVAMDLVRKITEKTISGGIYDIDALATDTLEDCKAAATAIIEIFAEEINRQIRDDKKGRKEMGLVLKDKNRTRKLLTELGELKFSRDYYYDKDNACYVSVLDNVIGIRAYERIGDSLSAKMIRLATDMSYAKSADVSCNGKVSRQTVKNHIRKLRGFEFQPKTTELRSVKELHIFADEDHVHMQKPHKRKGRKSKTVPLVTVTEGMEKESDTRNKAIEKIHFVDENFNTKNLWKSVEGYIGMRYKMEDIERIYIHADGGQWIKNGLDSFKQVTHVIDGYHLEKKLKEISNKFHGRNITPRLRSAIKNNDKKRADEVLQSIYRFAKDEKDIKYISKFGKYVMGNWEAIVNRMTLDISGSCTEGQVSHVLSERFSRDPMGWSEQGLGILSKLRVYVQNGGEITGDTLKKNQEMKYIDYADKVIKDSISGAIDWSIFDREAVIMNGASGTQILIKRYSDICNALVN